MNGKFLSIALIVFGLAGNGVASADLYAFSGTVTLCTGTCASFASLDTNTHVTGTYEINTSSSGAWGFADVGVFQAEVLNPAVPLEPFDGTNPTTANPLPLVATVAPITAAGGGLTTSGTTGAANELSSGNILHEFIVPPFNSNGAWVIFDIGAGGVTQAQVCLFFPTAGCIPGATQAVVIDGQFSLVSPPLNADPSSIDFGQVMIGQSALVDVTLTSLFDGVTVPLLDGLVAPFSFGQDNCSLQFLLLLETCTVTVEFQPTSVGIFMDDFDITVGGFGEDLVSVTGEAIGGGGNDQDGDGVTDDIDNCTLVANSAQRDTDGDRIGNFCDADLNNDCDINFLDLGLLKSVFFSADPDADLNGDGDVNFLDLGLMKATFFGPPGPGAPGNICEPS